MDPRAIAGEETAMTQIIRKNLSRYRRLRCSGTREGAPAAKQRTLPPLPLRH